MAERSDAKGKLRYDLIPHEAMDGAALGFTLGVEQHAERDWEISRRRWGKHFCSLLNHAWKFWRGQEFDADGKHHLDGVICNAMILRAMVARRIGEDDRPKMGDPK